MADLGHNSGRGKPTQWQTPHLPHDHRHEAPEPKEPDLDLVETAFVQGFEAAADPTSFLRLAKVPFVTERDGAKLELLRVQVENTVDVASVTPWMGGGGHRVAPLPASLVSRRGRLRFVYLTSDQRLELSLAEVRDLPDLTPPVGDWMP